MKFHGLFIGIDRYANSKIPWLNGAVRDASALHALFTDTIQGYSHVLLTDEQATREEIRLALGKLVSEAEADDIVVIFYAGHGSDTHEIICYDTDIDDVPGTSLALEELGETLSKINGRTVLCALDCCFSGGLGSRVFATGIRERGLARKSPTEILSRFTGTGRVVLTASADDEPALESARHGHGLFTYRLMEALQGADDVRINDQIDLLKLIRYVNERVLADAAQMHRVQTPTLRGQLDGVLQWPIFVPGDSYARLFPERVRQPATEDLTSLLPFGIPQSFLDVWSGTITKLNDLQLRAINECGLLDGENLVVTAPTSSGKTMVGELAALKVAALRGKTIFLLPMKALVNDKYEHFNRLYGPAGIKTIRATGDYSDQVSELLKGQYDFALLTYEKLTHLALANSHLLDSVSVVVVDEAQTLTDETRGSNLEFLMTILNNRRGNNGSPQIITLSAVVGDLGGLDRWLNAKNLHTEARPVPLREGVLDRSGHLQYLDETGAEATASSFIQPIYHEGSRSIVIPLVKRLVDEGKKVIVFRQSKGEVVGCAIYLANSLGLPAASGVLDELTAGEPSASTLALRRALTSGVALHTSDLDKTERQAIEKAFRDPESGLDVVVATPTLAMGVNTPASAVVIVGLTHPGLVSTAYTVAEYKNMVGRAGRLGFTESGESYLIPEGALDSGRAWRNYVQGHLEPLQSKLVVNGDPRTLMLRVLAQYQSETGESVREDDVVDFLNFSFAAFQAKEGGNAQWDTDQLRYGFEQLVSAQLLERDGSGLRLTALGRFAGESGVHVDSIIRLSAALVGLDVDAIKSTTLIAAAQLTNELDDRYINASLRRGSPEHHLWSSMLQQQDVAGSVRVAMGRTAKDSNQAVSRAKRAIAVIMWANAVPMNELEAKLSQHINYNRPAMAGVVRSIAERTRDLLPAVVAVLVELYPESAESINILANRTISRLEFGVSPELLVISGIDNELTRPQLLSLKMAGLISPQQVVDTSLESLTVTLSSNVDAERLQQACVASLNDARQPEVFAALPAPIE